MAPVVWMALLFMNAVEPGERTDVRLRDTLVWIDMAASPVPETVVRGEAQRLLAQVGLAPAWRRGAPQRVLAHDEIPVVLLDRDAASRPGGARVLGACKPKGAANGLWLYMDNVRWLLGLRAGPLGADDARRMALALGRILAHEVIHLIAPGLPHARSGLMSASLDRGTLLAGDIAIDAATRRALLLRAPRAVARRLSVRSTS